MAYTLYGSNANVSTWRADAATFDGTEDTIVMSNVLSGDTKQLILSMWINLTDETVNNQSLYYTTQSFKKQDFYITSTNQFGFKVVDVAGTTVVDWLTNTNAWIVGNWYHILVSYDGASGTLHTYINGVDVQGTVRTVLMGDAVNWTTTTTTLKGNVIAFSLSEFYSTNEYIDFSDEYNRYKFISVSGKPVYLGANGSLPTGTEPLRLANGNPFIVGGSVNTGVSGTGSLTYSTNLPVEVS